MEGAFINRKLRIGNWKTGTKNRELGSDNQNPITGNRESDIGNQERGTETGNGEPGTNLTLIT